MANREAGSPGSLSYATINWRYNADYEGAFNWVNSTWLAQGGGRYAAHPYDASPRQQVRVFMAHANPQDWPRTYAPCAYLR